MLTSLPLTRNLNRYVSKQSTNTVYAVIMMMSRTVMPVMMRISPSPMIAMMMMMMMMMTMILLLEFDHLPSPLHAMMRLLRRYSVVHRQRKDMRKF